MESCRQVCVSALIERVRASHYGGWFHVICKKNHVIYHVINHVINHVILNITLKQRLYNVMLHLSTVKFIRKNHVISRGSMKNHVIIKKGLKNHVINHVTYHVIIT
jgi:hypothetical protein